MKYYDSIVHLELSYGFKDTKPQTHWNICLYEGGAIGEGFKYSSLTSVAPTQVKKIR